MMMVRKLILQIFLLGWNIFTIMDFYRIGAFERHLESINQDALWPQLSGQKYF